MLIIQIGNLNINIPEPRFRFGFRRGTIVKWCVLFGVGSVAWWPKGFDSLVYIKFHRR